MKKMKKIVSGLLVAIALTLSINTVSIVDYKDSKAGIIVPMVDPPGN